MAVLGWHVRFVPTSDIPDVLPKSIGGRRLNVIRCAFRLLGLGALAPHPSIHAGPRAHSHRRKRSGVATHGRLGLSRAGFPKL